LYTYQYADELKPSIQAPKYVDTSHGCIGRSKDLRFIR